MKNFFVVCLAVAALLLAGCVPAGEMLRFNPESYDALRIGVVLPLSGPQAEYGKKMLNGARFAADELNNHRGHFGRPVELVVFDTASTGDGAAQAFQSAVSAGVVGVVGGYSTVEAQGITPLAKVHRVPLVIPMATGDDDVIGGNSFVFRAVFTDKQQSEMIAGYMKYYRNIKRIVVTVSADPGDIYSRNVARDVADSFRKLGGEVSSFMEISPVSPEKALGESVAYAPDAILLPFEGKLAARYYKILREAGYNGLICGPDSWDDPVFFKTLQGIKSPGNSFYTAFYSDEASHIEFKNFRENFRKKRYYFPGSCEIQTFDAVNMLLAGFGNNGNTLRKFNRNWTALRKYTGAAAVYTMLPKNRIDRTIYINRIGTAPEDGRRLVPRNIAGLQYSRLQDYAMDVED